MQHAGQGAQRRVIKENPGRSALLPDGQRQAYDHKKAVRLQARHALTLPPRENSIDMQS
jgi:hypothetical protein